MVTPPLLLQMIAQTQFSDQRLDQWPASSRDTGHSEGRAIIQNGINSPTKCSEYHYSNWIDLFVSSQPSGLWSREGKCSFQPSKEAKMKLVESETYRNTPHNQRSPISMPHFGPEGMTSILWAGASRESDRLFALTAGIREVLRGQTLRRAWEILALRVSALSNHTQ